VVDNLRPKYRRDPVKRRAEALAYYYKNREKVLARLRAQYACDPERFRVRVRLARPKHSVRERQRRAENPHLRIKNRLRARFHEVLKGKAKSGSILDLLGCTPEQLRAHLERQFRPGMSWANAGEWHVDHIRPCASFDLTDPAQQRVCFHYTNLQPLWAVDNLKKGARLSAAA
jgi:hypothetical protein